MMWHPYGMGAGMGPAATFGVLVPLVLLGVAAVLVVLAVRGGAERSTAARSLAERYARGEIDEAEYVRRSGVLDAPALPPAEAPGAATRTAGK